VALTPRGGARLRAYVQNSDAEQSGSVVTGLSALKFGRFDGYTFNPLRANVVVAIPIMVAAGYEVDRSAAHTGPGARPEIA
jgi:hypothetical protein